MAGFVCQRSHTPCVVSLADVLPAPSRVVLVPPELVVMTTRVEFVAGPGPCTGTAAVSGFEPPVDAGVEEGAAELVLADSAVGKERWLVVSSWVPVLLCLSCLSNWAG